jgi:hypothetical protein
MAAVFMIVSPWVRGPGPFRLPWRKDADQRGVTIFDETSRKSRLRIFFQQDNYVMAITDVPADPSTHDERQTPKERGHATRHDKPPRIGQ